MENALDLHSRHGRALKRGQQNTAQRITERQTKTALQRFGDNLAGVRHIAVGNIQFRRLNQFLPVFMYQGQLLFL